MAEQLLSDIISSSSDAITAGTGFFSLLYANHMKSYERADAYLENRILNTKDHIITDEDLEVAAKLYAIPKMRKEYKNIAKTLKKADALFQRRVSHTKETPKEIDSDLFDYIMDKAKLISSEQLQSLWASLLVQSSLQPGTLRKVMLDRIALLDQKTATLFGLLCTMTYKLTVSDGREYLFPFYIRAKNLQKLVTYKNCQYTNEDRDKYKALFSTDDEIGIDYENIEDELEVLQDIGLIKISEHDDEGDVYTVEKSSFSIEVGSQNWTIHSAFDEIERIYFIITGCLEYTTIGLELCNALMERYPVNESFAKTLKEYQNSLFWGKA